MPKFKCESTRALQITILIWIGRKHLSLFRMPIHWNILFDILFIWNFQGRCSSKVSPRKLISATLSMLTLSIFNVKFYNTICVVYAFWVQCCICILRTRSLYHIHKMMSYNEIWCHASTKGGFYSSGKLTLTI